MATVKSYTDLEQSKKLAEILPIESADMVYFGIHQGMDGKYYLSGTNTEEDVVPIYKNLCTKVFTKTTTNDIICMLPCWSLAALLSVIRKTIGYTLYGINNVYMSCNLGDKPWKLETEVYDNEVDACVVMIEKLNEENLL